MRICFYNTDGEWTGRARAFVDAAAALGARGHEVIVACATEGSVARVSHERHVETVSWRSSGGRLRRAWQLRGVLRRHLADVVFVHSGREQLEAAIAVRLADRGVLVRRVPPLSPFTAGREARLAGRIAPTGFLFALEHDRKGVTPPSRALEAVVAPPGVALTALAPAGDVHGPSVAVLLATARRRGTLAALGGLALVAERHPALRVLVLAPGAASDELRIQVAALRMGGSVQYVDTVANPAAASRAWAAAEVALVLADHDDAAFGVLDSCAAGVPAIVERSSLTAGLVSDGESGVLTHALGAEEYAALVAGLLADRARRAVLARGALAAAARWPLAAMADAFERSAASAHDRSPWRV